MIQEELNLIIGKSDEVQKLYLPLANRHGLVAGATGTGKTVTLQILAEGFVEQGVPVFMADIKGDLSGITQTGSDKPKLKERADKTGVNGYSPQGFPTIFWDLFGKRGHALRTTVSEIGPLLLSRLLQLNEVQEGIINVLFQLADDQGLLLLDLKDLRSMLTYVGEHSKELTLEYGSVSKRSIGAIQRKLLVLEQQGAENFFAEPALNLDDFMRTTREGKGYINLLLADELMAAPNLYTTFLLWLLSELFEELPEVGDLDKPKLVFFFDEAHLLFKNAPKAFIEKVEQVVRLIRSKGVGVYFITQNPTDIPDTILSQLGNRIQHALRAFTPRDQKAVKASAETFRQNPSFDVKEVITQLGVGEALVSTLDPDGIPRIVQQTKIRPPESRMGPITDAEHAEVRKQSPIGNYYDEEIDRESAFEQIKARRKIKEDEAAKAEEALEKEKAEKEKETKKRSSKRGESFAQTAMKSVTRIITSSLGQRIIRGILGSFLKR
jgi:DNA helicase HerA-like ATPase